ncbi:MAG: hypothetical protein Q9220_004101 [cf. Caloplaca sp. 1 TL-2023]
MDYSPENVVPNPLTGSSDRASNGGDPGLQLIVQGGTPEGAPVRTAELVTSRTDMHYGSYRAAIKYTREPGTCGSMFWWKNATQEIDVELLSWQDSGSGPTSPVNFVLHASGPSTFEQPSLPFHPSDGYHEYRFDWSPGKVAYYADGQHILDATEGVPVDPGRILMNHWSNGDPAWTKGPPAKDAIMTVAYVKAYFNTLETQTSCNNADVEGAVCQVPDQKGPITPGQDTTFLTPQASNPSSTTQATTPAPSRGAGADQVSPDATCGGTTGFTCLGSEKGNCCSSHGWW